MHECALLSDRMNHVMVTHYNLILKEVFYPKQWTKTLNTMLGKGKGMVLGKLRIITLIEADMQNIMRIFLNDGDEEKIETDKRFSKANYGSRKNYSIELAILEKRLIFDNSLLINKVNVYAMTDLESCYDR